MNSDRDRMAKAPDAPGLFGLLAEYEAPDHLLRAANRVREAGFKCWDTFTPFPVHGIDGAMGIKPTILPWLVFGAGLTGCIAGVLLQWGTNAVQIDYGVTQSYQWIVSGKPFWSIPANIPIIFELTVLFSALTALVGMLVLNNLPQLSHPVDLKERFARATDDRFFLLIEAKDPKFDEDRTRRILDETSPVVLDEVAEDARPSRLPKALVYGGVVLAIAALVPLALVAQARTEKSRKPRIHLVQDMDFQSKYKAQSENQFFHDGRTMRGSIPGTVAIDELRSDHLALGKLDGAFARTFPQEIEISDATMARGQERFGVYCAPCHGLAGRGDGMIAKRAEKLAQGTWVPPSNLNQDYLRQQPIGQLFDSISNGVRNMPGYGSQISPEDRWAILLYVRALQRHSAASLADIPPEQRGVLE
jgi:mono/diheme cytochrome c family protein